MAKKQLDRTVQQITDQFQRIVRAGTIMADMQSMAARVDAAYFKALLENGLTRAEALQLTAQQKVINTLLYTPKKGEEKHEHEQHQNGDREGNGSDTGIPDTDRTTGS